MPGRNDFRDGGIFFGLFLAPEKKFCLTINIYWIIHEHKTFKVFINVSENLDRKEYFKKFDFDKLFA